MSKDVMTPIKRFFSSPTSWGIITRFLLNLLLVLLIATVFRFLFFSTCLSVGSVRECVASNINSTDTLFAIGGILVAIVALIPTFWIEGKIRDAKEEIGKKIFEDIQKDMQRLSQAQILIFEADRHQGVGELLSKELFVQEAIRLWPPFEQEEYRKLGNAFSSAVIQEFYHGLSRSMTVQAMTASLNREQVRLYLSKAIFYLETIKNSKAPSRDELVNLTCMYGCAVQYEDMIRTMEQAIKVDENAKDDFQEAKRLSLLVYACGTNRHVIEKLGKKIGKELPLSKAEFVSIVNKVDLQSRLGRYIRFFAVRRQPIPTADYIYLINIGAADKQGQRLVNGSYIPIKGDVRHDVTSIDEQITIEEFFDRVDKQLYIICFSED
jgi:hypothetical protein